MLNKVFDEDFQMFENLFKNFRQVFFRNLLKIHGNNFVQNISKMF